MSGFCTIYSNIEYKHPFSVNIKDLQCLLQVIKYFLQTEMHKAIQWYRTIIESLARYASARDLATCALLLPTNLLLNQKLKITFSFV